MLRPLELPLHLVLVAPQIPPNTGNIARLCAVTGSRLVLVEPLGFSIADRELKRAGLDYWDKVFVALYPDWNTYVTAHPAARRFLFTGRAAASLWSQRFRPGDHLVFGSESDGLPEALLAGGDGVPVAIPMLPDRRSLNLSTAAGVGTYEALRQLGVD
jgi:tRNA (cytidine/uridine-2'-O-)-methyltransferase